MYKEDKTLSIFTPLKGYLPVLNQKLKKFREFTNFHIFFARKNFRESAFAKFFVKITFANLPKIRENRESFFPPKYLPLKYKEGSYTALEFFILEAFIKTILGARTRMDRG